MLLLKVTPVVMVACLQGPRAEPQQAGVAVEPWQPQPHWGRVALCYLWPLIPERLCVLKLQPSVGQVLLFVLLSSGLERPKEEGLQQPGRLNGQVWASHE